jgi:hypothetical protein
LPLQKVRAVERRSVNLDEHLVISYYRIGYVRPDEITVFID